MTRTLVRSVGTFRTHDVPSDPSWAGESRIRREDEEGREPEIEIHNHIPAPEPDYNQLTSEEMQDRRPLRNLRNRDDEFEDDDDGEVVARYPANYHVETEGDEIVIYSKPPRSQRSDLLDFKSDDRRAARDAHAPHTLADMNNFLRSFYPRKRTTAAR